MSEESKQSEAAVKKRFHIYKRLLISHLGREPWTRQKLMRSAKPSLARAGPASSASDETRVSCKENCFAIVNQRHSHGRGALAWCRDDERRGLAGCTTRSARSVSRLRRLNRAPSSTTSRCTQRTQPEQRGTFSRLRPSLTVSCSRCAIRIAPVSKVITCRFGPCPPKMTHFWKV